MLINSIAHKPLTLRPGGPTFNKTYLETISSDTETTAKFVPMSSARKELSMSSSRLLWGRQSLNPILRQQRKVPFKCSLEQTYLVQIQVPIKLNSRRCSPFLSDSKYFQMKGCVSPPCAHIEEIWANCYAQNASTKSFAR